MTIKDRICLIIAVFCCTLTSITLIDNNKKPLLLPVPEQQIPYVELLPLPTAPITPIDAELANVQVPIPKSMRVYNKSGVQCVWASCQTLSLFNNAKAGQNLTDTYKSPSGPGEVNRVLSGRKIKFKQVNGKDYDFLEKYVTNEKRGCGIGVNNGAHALVICHFERNKLVKIIDNSDRNLRIQTWDWSKFQRVFSGWCFVIFPDDYVIPTYWDNDIPDDGKLYSSS